MWQRIKTIFKPVTDFFTGPFANFFSYIVTSIRKCFVSDQPRAEHQPLLQGSDARTSSAPLLQALKTDQPSDRSLLDLPDDMLKEIGSWLPDQPQLQDKGLLSVFSSSQKKPGPLSSYVGSAKRFHLLLQPQRLLNQFLQSVVYGNQKKAEDILDQLKKTAPGLLAQLLTQKCTVVDYSGRTIHGTALQIALGAEDVKYHDNEECMTEMLMRHLKTLPNGDDIIAKQIQEQFPEGWEEIEKARQERDLAELKKVVAAIESAQDGDNCDAAILVFRKYLDDENGRGVIKTGKHFNMQLLVDAFNLYVEKYDQFGGNWHSPKNILFWRKIIGGIERYLPACYAQAFCQGVYQIVEDLEKLDRRLALRFDSKVTFYPLDSDPAFRLGEDYAWGGCWAIVGAPPPVAWRTMQTTMSNKKHQRRGDYAAAAKQPVRELPCRKVTS